MTPDQQAFWKRNEMDAVCDALPLGVPCATCGRSSYDHEIKAALRPDPPALLAGAAALLAQDWRDIESAPKDGTLVLTIAMNDIRNGRPNQSLARWSTRGRWLTTPGAYAICPSHWMPLPSPPRVSQERS